MQNGTPTATHKYGVSLGYFCRATARRVANSLKPELNTAHVLQTCPCRRESCATQRHQPATRCGQACVCLSGGSKQEAGLQNKGEGAVDQRAPRGKLASFKTLIDHPIRRASGPLHRSNPNEARVLKDLQGHLRRVARSRMHRLSNDSIRCESVAYDPNHVENRLLRANHDYTRAARRSKVATNNKEEGGAQEEDLVNDWHGRATAGDRMQRRRRQHIVIVIVVAASGKLMLQSTMRRS